MNRRSKNDLFSAAVAATLFLFAAGASAAQTSRADLYQQSDRAEALVVRLTAPTTEGAGVIFHVDDRYAFGFTAKHVLYQQGKNVSELRVDFRPWPGRSLPAEVYRLHYEKDLAVFRVDLSPLGLSPAELKRVIPMDQLGSSVELDPGDSLGAVGHSTAGSWLTPKEPVRFARGDSPDSFLFELQCPQGHSGGGVFDVEWRVVGMMIDEERPYCRALRIEPVMKIVQGWKLGIDLRPPPSKKTAGSLEKDVRVAVVDFDNRSGKDLPNLGYVAQDITTTFLSTVPGVVLVTRDRLDSVKKEHGIPGTIQAGKGATQVGHLVKADALVTGSILRYEVERRQFEGFGTTALQDISHMAISLQVLDVETGVVRYTNTFDVERTKQYPKATSAPGEPIDRTSELLTALLDQAQGDMKSALQQIGSGLNRAGQFIQVPVASSPAGADVILNGIFMGNTPLNLQMTLAEHEIEIHLGGYESWHQRVKVQPGLTISARLVRK